MIPPYDGALDPLSPGELQRRIANCDAVIDRLRAKGLTNFVAGWQRRKRQYQLRLDNYDKRGRTVPLVGMQQISDEEWNRRSGNEAD